MSRLQLHYNDAVAAVMKANTDGHIRCIHDIVCCNILLTITIGNMHISPEAYCRTLLILR